MAVEKENLQIIDILLSATSIDLYVQNILKNICIQFYIQNFDKINE